MHVLRDRLVVAEGVDVGWLRCTVYPVGELVQRVASRVGARLGWLVGDSAWLVERWVSQRVVGQEEKVVVCETGRCCHDRIHTSVVVVPHRDVPVEGMALWPVGVTILVDRT